MLGKLLILLTLSLIFLSVNAVIPTVLSLHTYTTGNIQDECGKSVSSTGDINGDNLPDVIIGCSSADVTAGAAYVIFSEMHSYFPEKNVDLTQLDGDNGFKILSTGAGQFTGYAVAGVNDVNGDGYDDFLISSIGQAGFAGAAFLVHGKAAWAATFDLSTLDGTNGVKFYSGNGGDRVGYSLGSAGDFNGDGYADFLISIPFAGPSNHGKVALIYGHSGPWGSPVISMNSIYGSTGILFNGTEDNALLGYSDVSSADINNDGFTDVIMSAPYSNYATTDAGIVYVIFGNSSFPAFFNISNVDGTDGFRIPGQYSSDLLGKSLAGAGDVNGDGYEDFLIGHQFKLSNDSGSAYLIYGKAGNWSATNPFWLTSLNGFNGVEFTGSDPNDQAGWDVSAAGDVNADGFSDFMISAPNAQGNKGEVYLLLGGSSFNATNDLTYMDNVFGWQIEGTTPSQAGFSIAAAGDLNGDGYDDILVGSNGTVWAMNPGCGGVYGIYDDGGTICKSCDQGHYNVPNFRTECFACPEGTFADNYGSSSCQDCPVGYIQIFQGQSFCFPCGFGYTSNEDYSQCIVDTNADSSKTSSTNTDTNDTGLTVGLVLGFAAVGASLIFIYYRQNHPQMLGTDNNEETETELSQIPKVEEPPRNELPPPNLHENVPSGDPSPPTDAYPSGFMSHGTTEVPV